MVNNVRSTFGSDNLDKSDSKVKGIVLGSSTTWWTGLDLIARSRE
jgi:hypothetical protein